MSEENTPEIQEPKPELTQEQPLDRTQTPFFIYREVVGLICILALHLFFTYVFLQKVIYDHSMSSLMHFLYETMLVIFILMRNSANDVSENYQDWIVGILGTVLPLMLRPAEVPVEYAFLISFQVVGFTISAIGLMSLNKSIGIVAANRGIKTNGIYKYIRHPLYAGYFISLIAFMSQNFTMYNLSILAVFIIMQLGRIFAEEKILLQDPEYKAYAEQTKWRLFPYIW